MRHNSAAGFRLVQYRSAGLPKALCLAITLEVLTLFSAHASGQTTSNYPGSVEGRITCNDGGFPARNAHISLTRIDSLLNSNASVQFPEFDSNTRTDFDGNYILPGVPPGEYLVTVRQAGYIDEVGLVLQALKRFSPEKQKDLLGNLPQVMVRSGRARKDIVVRRGGAISGRVTFPDGGALDGARLRIVMVSGELVGALRNGGVSDPFEIRISQPVTTDDRGFYRIAGLPKGIYRISVQDRVQIFASNAVKESEAKLFSVDEGDEVSDGDVTIPIQLFHSISGIVMRGGSPIANASVTIRRQGETATYGGGETKSDGLYNFPMQLSGTYVIEAQYPADSPEIDRSITVQLGDSDVIGANIDLLSHRPAD